MNPAELYEVFYAATGIVNELLEFTISISFAVVVTAYLASARLNGFLYIAMGAVYTATTTVLTVRMGIQIDKLREIKQRLAEHNERFTDFESFLPIATSLSGVLIYTSTIGFLIYAYVKLAATKPAVEVVP